MRLAIRHESHYEYSSALDYALQHLCLTPQPGAHQQVLDWSVSAPGRLFAQRDGYGNLAHTWSLERVPGARRVYRGTVLAAGTVRTRGVAWLDETPELPHPALYLRPTVLTEPDAEIAVLGRAHLARRADEAALRRLAAAVRERVRYRAGVTHVGTTAREALALRAGVCQDQAQVFIAACRAAGVPARYVSGYFHSPRAAELASHAWAEACVDVAARRWLSLDVTHDAPMDERHVRLAAGPDYAACAPIRGVREGGGDETLRVAMQVREIDEEVNEEVLLEP